MSIIKRCEIFILSDIIAWLAVITVGGTFNITNAYLDLVVAAALLYIALLFWSPKTLAVPVFLALLLSCLAILSACFIAGEGYLGYKFIAGVTWGLVVLTIIALIILRNENAASLWQRKEAFFLAAQKLSHTGSVGIIIGREVSLSWSEESSRIFECPPDVIPTLDLVRARTHPDDLSIVDNVLEQAASRQNLIEIEHRLIMSDGRIKHVQMVASPILKNGKHIEYFGALMDVTASKQSEEALFHSQARLAHMTRLSSMGELAASIVHEINQPLAALITSGECCKRWINRPEPNLEEVRKSVDRIIQNSVRISNVITCIRALSRQSELQRTVEPFDAIVSESLALMQHDISYHEVRPHSHLGAPNAFIRGDRVQLQQVIINLIINACQAMASIHERARILRIHTSVNDSEVVLEIADSGCGIATEILPSLFDPFFTTKPTGLGIGLSICRSIIEFHGGRIWVSSTVGDGTQFKFAIPLAPSREDEESSFISASL